MGFVWFFCGRFNLVVLVLNVDSGKRSGHGKKNFYNGN